MNRNPKMTYLDFDYRKITPAMLEQVMLNYKWIKVETREGLAAIWKSRVAGTKLWVPVLTTYADYEERIYEVIDTIADRNGCTDV
ncbi:MAG: hypothetical protein ACI8WB_003306 [Phenylobacterium sp.]|jgi:hypothetical protein